MFDEAFADEEAKANLHENAHERERKEVGGRPSPSQHTSLVKDVVSSHNVESSWHKDSLSTEDNTRASVKCVEKDDNANADSAESERIKRAHSVEEERLQNESEKAAGEGKSEGGKKESDHDLFKVQHVLVARSQAVEVSSRSAVRYLHTCFCGSISCQS